MTIDQRAQSSSRGRGTATGRGTARRRVVAAVLAASALGGGLVAAEPVVSAAPAAASSTWEPVRASGWCLSRTGPVVRRAGYQSRQLRLYSTPFRTTVDARGALWAGTNYPVSLSGRPYACVSGGRYRGTWATTRSWAFMHGIAAIRSTNYAPVVESVRIRNYGDGIRFSYGAQSWRVRRAYLSYLRDDCIENDWSYSGVVDDSLFDGCYNAFSSRSYDTQANRRNGSNDVVTVQNSLVRLRPMKSVYKNRGLVPGHAGFFKWSDTGPKLVLRNNVFRADQDASTVGLAIPADKLAGCSNNVMVWLGKGPYPEKLPSCFRVTRDVRVWDDAALAWKKAHGWA